MTMYSSILLSRRTAAAVSRNRAIASPIEHGAHVDRAFISYQAQHFQFFIVGGG